MELILFQISCPMMLAAGDPRSTVCVWVRVHLGRVRACGHQWRHVLPGHYHRNRVFWQWGPSSSSWTLTCESTVWETRHKIWPTICLSAIQLWIGNPVVTLVVIKIDYVKNMLLTFIDYLNTNYWNICHGSATHIHQKPRQSQFDANIVAWSYESELFDEYTNIVVPNQQTMNHCSYPTYISISNDIV
jgi:hypothetical protein